MKNNNSLVWGQEHTDYKLVAESGFFNAEWYLRQNPDVLRAGIDPLSHYITAGAFEGRRPNPQFDSAWYLAQYPDVRASKLNPLVHYLKHGVSERRASNAMQLSDLDPANMWGRAFDLSKKECVHLTGFDLYVMPNDYVGKSILDSNSYEPHVTSAILRELDDADVFVDIGANVGYFTMMAAAVVHNGKVLSFEPNHQNLQLIYASLLRNNFPNVKVFPYAVSDTEGLLRFQTVGSNGGVVTQHAQSDRYHFYVQSVVLDDILRDEPRIDIIKMDIEGHEPSALSGMERMIKKHKPKLFTEFHPLGLKVLNPGDPAAYLHRLVAQGYDLSILHFDQTVTSHTTVDDVLAYWASLNNETIHLDLLAEPK